MSLLRLILLCAVVWLIWRYWRRTTARKRSAAPREFTAMVRCAQCGVHLPQAQAVQVKALTFCSQQHADEHAQQSDG